MIDTKKRNLVKAITWRVVASIVLGTLTWILTGSIQAIGFMLLFFNLIQICTYFLYERLWNHISWGRTSGIFIQMTGLSGSGKTTISRAVAKRLVKEGYKLEIMDGDEYRSELCRDLGFSKEDRNSNIRRLGFVGKVLARNRVIAIMAAINPYDEIRKELTALGPFVKLVHINCDIYTLIDRDPKGLYKKALSGEISNFTGISDPFEVPKNPDLVINTDKETLEQSTNKLYKFIIGEINK